MKKIVFIVVVAIAFCCSDEEGDKVIVYDESYFPLHVGDRWEYSHADPQFSHLSHVTKEVTGSARFSDQEYYVVKGTYSYELGQGTPNIELYYFRLGENGFIYSYNENTGIESNPYRLGAAEGDHWNVPVPSPHFKERAVYVTNVGTYQSGETIIEDCKTFIEDTQLWADDDHMSVLAPGIGIVHEGSSGGYYVTIRRAVINGTEYHF
jgi:hypothetical protein